MHETSFPENLYYFFGHFVVKSVFFLCINCQIAVCLRQTSDCSYCSHLTKGPYDCKRGNMKCPKLHVTCSM